MSASGRRRLADLARVARRRMRPPPWPPRRQDPGRHPAARRRRRSTAFRTRGCRCPRRLGAFGAALRQQVVEVGADDAVGAGGGERVAGAAVGREQLLRRLRPRRSTCDRRRLLVPPCARAMNGITSTHTAAKIPKMTKGVLLIRLRRPGKRAQILAPSRSASTRAHAPQAALAAARPAAGRPGGRARSGSCAARRRPRAAVIASISSCASSNEAPGRNRPSRPPTRWTWVSTGISGRPKAKISTQAAVLRPTPGQRRQVIERLLAGRVAQASRGRSGRRVGARIGLDPRRLGVREPAPADRLLDLARAARRGPPPRWGSARAGRRRRRRGWCRRCSGRGSSGPARGPGPRGARWPAARTSPAAGRDREDTAPPRPPPSLFRLRPRHRA